MTSPQAVDGPIDEMRGKNIVEVKIIRKTTKIPDKKNQTFIEGILKRFERIIGGKNGIREDGTSTWRYNEKIK